jgi:hypothetical protein
LRNCNVRPHVYGDERQGKDDGSQCQMVAHVYEWSSGVGDTVRSHRDERPVLVTCTAERLRTQREERKR